jgi:hypothetical protein
MKFFLYILVFIGLFSVSCKKEKPIPVDYRDIYVGKYLGVATMIHSVYSGTYTYRDTTINNDSIVTITKVGGYPSEKISMNGGTSFPLPKNNIVGYTGGNRYVEFKFPTIHVFGHGSGVSYEYYAWDFKGEKTK